MLNNSDIVRWHVSSIKSPLFYAAFCNLFDINSWKLLFYQLIRARVAIQLGRYQYFRGNPQSFPRESKPRARGKGQKRSRRSGEAERIKARKSTADGVSMERIVAGPSEGSGEIISSRGRSLCLRSCQAAGARSDADCTYTSGM